MKTIISLLFLQLFAYNSVAQQRTYKAAVVEYAPILKAGTPNERLLENMKEYRVLMSQAGAKNVQIIVFPEDGLTGWEGIDHTTVDGLSTIVPDPSQKIAPCNPKNSVNFSTFFVDLSCAAETHNMYTVVNLIEKHYTNKTNITSYHNTNVVFDKKGVVIAKYRKINLFNEPAFVPGNNTVTFTTDFDVTFGMFTCFDIMFKNPAVDILTDSSVTDIVYSAAWFSQLPFYGALSVQHGYAKANGVNLLASGLDDPLKGNGGSGIYYADGQVAETAIAGYRYNKLIIQDIPIRQKRPSEVCQGASASVPLIEPHSFGLGMGKLPNISSFKTSIENTTNYSFKALNLKKANIVQQICSGKFCCSFNITVSRNASAPLNYVYKLLAYYGVTKFSTNDTLGLSNCGLVACLNDNNDSCGGRHTEAPTGVIFESITVKATFNLNSSFPQPATLQYDLRPITEYTYCKTMNSNNSIEIYMATTHKQDSLLTFGIYGRLFNYDHEPAGPINNANILNRNICIAFIISILIFLLQD